MPRDREPRALPEPLPVIERSSVGAAALVDDRLAGALEDLRLLPCPASLAPLLGWSADGSLVLVHQVPADSVPLGSLRAQGPLRAEHVLEVGVAVATALVALPGAGLAHGCVGLERVLVGPDGRVVLAGTGAGWAGAPGRPDGARPEEDVAALGDLLRLLLGAGGAPGPLVVAALRACDSDPALRPSAPDLAAALERCGRREPLLGPLWGSGRRSASDAGPDHDGSGDAPGSRDRSPRPAVAPRPSAVSARADGRGARASSTAARARHRHRRRRRQRPGAARAVLGAVALCLVALLVARAVPAVVASAGEPRPAGPVAVTASSDPSRPTVDWTAVLAALDSGRRAALVSRSVDELARYVDPAGAAWADDAALQARLSSSGARLEGGGLEIDVVRLEREGSGTVRLAVRDRRLPYDVVEAGRTTRVPERAWRWWTVTLTWSPSLDGPVWRVADVRGADDRAAP